MTAIRTKVTAEFANIAQYDTDTGSVFGINLLGNQSATNSITGTFVVGAADQPSNLMLSTSIGNGNINTGGILAVGGASTQTGEGTVRTQAGANGFWLQSYDQTGNIAHQFYSSNGNANGDSTFAIASNSTNIFIADINGVTVPQTINVGSSSQSNITRMVLSTANTVDSGISFEKSGVERWFLGADDSRSTGNFVVTGPGGTYWNCLYDGTNSFVTSPVTNRMAVYRKTSFTQARNTNTIIDWDITDSSIPGTTMTSGVFTNTGPARKFTFTFQCSWSGLETTVELNQWFSLNGTVTTTNRYGRWSLNTPPATQMINTITWSVFLNTNSTVRCYTYHSSNTTVTNGGGQFGSASDYSTVLTIVEG